MWKDKTRAGLLIPHSMARRMFPEMRDMLDAHPNEVMVLEVVDGNEMILTKEEVEAELAKRRQAEAEKSGEDKEQNMEV